MPKTKELVMQQILAAPWGDASNGVRTYSVLGLSRDGKVYRYDVQCSGWIPYNMKPAACKKPHRR